MIKKRLRVIKRAEEASNIRQSRFQRKEYFREKKGHFIMIKG